jgi:hypothetical protein
MDPRIVEAITASPARTLATSPVIRPRWRATSVAWRGVAADRPQGVRPVSPDGARETVAVLEARMKYFVNVGDREIEVVVDGERVTVAGRTVVVHRTGIVGTPLHQVMIEGRRCSCRSERLGPGRWSVTAWGERRDAHGAG